MLAGTLLAVTHALTPVWDARAAEQRRRDRGGRTPRLRRMTPDRRGGDLNQLRDCRSPLRSRTYATKNLARCKEFGGKRRGADSNRCTRLCRPLPNLSATAPARLPS